MDWRAFNEEVIFGDAGGRVLWQPRIGCWYTDKQFAGEPLPERYQGMSLPEIYRDLGCSDRLYQYNACYRRVEDPRVHVTQKDLGERRTETTIETPVGKQVAVHQVRQSNPLALTLKWEVTTEEELRVATWREEHATYAWDQDAYDALLRDVGDLGAPTMFMPRMNVQSLYIEKMGTQNGIYAIFEWPEAVTAYFEALGECHDRLMEVINAGPIRIINYGENVHSGTLSPDLFLQYHLPECQRRSETLRAAGNFVYSHWDGDCKPLLPYARETGMNGIEAITPVPQGDVTLEEMKEGLGDDLWLLDGIPAVYFDETYPVEVLDECVARLLDLFAPKIVLGISDELSSHGDIERVRRVGALVDEYNAARAAG